MEPLNQDAEVQPNAEMQQVPVPPAFLAPPTQHK